MLCTLPEFVVLHPFCDDASLELLRVNLVAAEVVGLVPCIAGVSCIGFRLSVRTFFHLAFLFATDFLLSPS